MPKRKRLHLHNDEQHAGSNRLKLREEKFRLYIMKHSLLLEPMCHWHILRKRQSMPATGSFKSGKAEMLCSHWSWEQLGDSWWWLEGLRPACSVRPRLSFYLCALCSVLACVAETWVIVVLPSMSNAVLSKLRAYVGIYGFRFKKQPEKLLTSCEIICFDFLMLAYSPLALESWST